MATKVQTNDGMDHEEQTRREMLKICCDIARSAMNNLDQLSSSHPDRDDIQGFTVDHPVTPVTVYTKRGVTDDGWGYEWNRIHVEIAAPSIGTSAIMDIKRENNLEVVDVWQTNADRQKELGQHGEPAVEFALEPRE